MTVRTAAEIQEQIDTLLADNISREISEADIRSVLADIKDSIPSLAAREIESDKLDRYPENPQSIQAVQPGPFKLISEYTNVAYTVQAYNNEQVAAGSWMLTPQVNGERKLLINLTEVDQGAREVLTGDAVKGQMLRIMDGAVLSVLGRIKQVEKLVGHTYRITADNSPIVGAIAAGDEFTFAAGTALSRILRYPENPQDVQPAELAHYRSHRDLEYTVMAYNNAAYGANNIPPGFAMFSAPNSATTPLVKLALYESDLIALYPHMKVGERFDLISVDDDMTKWGGQIEFADALHLPNSHYVVEITIDTDVTHVQTQIAGGASFYAQIVGPWVEQINELIARSPGRGLPQRISGPEIGALNSQNVRSIAPADLRHMLSDHIPPADVTIEPNYLLRPNLTGDFELTLHSVIPLLVAGATQLEVQIGGQRVHLEAWSPTDQDDRHIEFTVTAAEIEGVKNNLDANDKQVQANIRFLNAANQLVSDVRYTFRVLAEAPSGAAAPGKFKPTLVHKVNVRFPSGAVFVAGGFNWPDNDWLGVTYNVDELPTVSEGMWIFRNPKKTVLTLPPVGASVAGARRTDANSIGLEIADFRINFGRTAAGAAIIASDTRNADALPLIIFGL